MRFGKYLVINNQNKTVKIADFVILNEVKNLDV
jgi:hypothetical protein